MSAEAPPGLSPITDEDIAWVSGILNLCDLDPARLEFLTRLDTLDVSACPGSGKTTLVVAKLALLARRWPWRTRGICVLSHTNVAREEIESRLGSSPVGHLLSGYPHFIGTIHSFLSQFLVQPFLLSRGKAFKVFDDDHADRTRRRILGWKANNLEAFLNQNHISISSLRIADADYNLAFFPVGPHTRTYQLAQEAIRGAAEQGDFCFDDVFPLAKAMLDEVPAVASILSQRFPFVLMDEMQDTDERQGDLLARIFLRDRAELCIQRVGDPNQAIFTKVQTQTQNTPFPDPGREISIADSFRFGTAIGDAASPLAIAPVRPSGLKGTGPARHRQVSPPPTIFLFPPEHPGIVLPAFGQAVLAAFPDGLPEGAKVVAVGAVHKTVDQPVATKQPQTLSDYWPSYLRSLARKDSHPATLAECVLMAQRKAQTEGTFQQAANHLAYAMLHLVRLAMGRTPGNLRGRAHRRFLDLLEPPAIAVYQALLASLLTRHEPLGESAWKELRPRFEALIYRITKGTALGPEGRAYLDWPGNLFVTGSEDATGLGPVNTYRHVEADRSVDIHLGSIHSVKGETHLATLVLETYRSAHMLESLIESLCGKPLNPRVSDLQKTRARLAYVAMTRPTHLLCLALRQSALGDGTKALKRRQALQDRGWRVVELRLPGPSGKSTPIPGSPPAVIAQ